jgi:hypothetical protein
MSAEARQRLEESILEMQKQIAELNADANYRAQAERRSIEWKMCYRAGKPAVDAARRAAEDWLKGLL